MKRRTRQGTSEVKAISNFKVIAQYLIPACFLLLIPFQNLPDYSSDVSSSHGVTLTYCADKSFSFCTKDNLEVFGLALVNERLNVLI